jgi:hypothetical protein
MNLITRHNYEEYFILYMDNELSAADKQMVELFAAQNPDLKDELDLLMQSKLVPDTNVVFEGKEMLMKDEASSPISGITEKLLLHLDNELPAGEKAGIEKLIDTDTAVIKEWQLLQQTKLPAEAIVFPNKESLYRKEETVRVVSIKWWRIAAAAVVLLGIGFGTYSILNKKGPADGPDVVAIDNKTENKATTPNNETGTKTISPVIELPKQEIATAPENKTEQKSLLVKQNNNAPIIKVDKKNNIIAPQERPLVVENNIIDKKKDLPLFEQNKEQKNKTANDAVALNDDKKNTPSQIIKKDDVTTDKLPRIINKQQNPEVPLYVTGPDEIETEKSGKKNKLRGFFRKATRIFEHTTNISAANEDDRLLIGGLAVRLK